MALRSPTIHASAVPRLQRQIEALGLPGREVLLAAGLREIHLEGNVRTPRAAFLAAKAEIARRLDDSCIGFRIGESTDIDEFDIFGAAIVHAGDLAEAMAIATRYFAVWEEGARMQLTHRDDWIRITYTNDLRGTLSDIIDSQQTTIFLGSICSRLFGAHHERFLGFACPPPRHDACRAAIRKQQCRVRFDEPDWYIEIAQEAFTKKRPTMHPAALRVIRQGLADELKTLQDEKDLLGRLHDVLRRGLPDGARVIDSAAALGLSPRTLQDHLHTLGTSYSAELELIRAQTAKELLMDRHCTIKEITAQVGYSSTAAFSRFFSGYVGMTPGEFRDKASK